MFPHLARRTFGLLVGLVVAFSAAAAPWGDLRSDMPADPAIKFGTLPNGLRYVVRPNKEPQHRVSLRLLVAAGSLVERDDERGLAHFIEHMAFRASKGYPDNSLVPSLERRGIGLGPDNTAFTSQDYTVYHLELPDTTPATLRLGLSVFREYAEGLTFPADAIERERGVVLSEKDTRDTPDERLSKAMFGILWPDSRQLSRVPIGVESLIRKFTRDQFVAFYDAWYRPERLAVIVVGDVATADVEPLVAEILGPLAARAPPREEPTDVAPEKATIPNVLTYYDNSLGGARFYFTHPQKRERQPDTHAERVRGLHRALAFAMFARRLNWAAQKRGSVFVAPGVSTDLYMPGWETVSFSASGRIDAWPKVAAALEQEHRRAYELGFTSDELELAKQKLAKDYEQDVRTAPTRRSEFFASQIGSCLLYGGVLSTPEDRQRDLAADLQAATLKECVKAFRSAWTGTQPHVLIATNGFFPATREQIRDVLNQSRNTVLKLPPLSQPVEFAYRRFGPPGTLATDSYVADLDVHLARFTNGVRLNFKSTTFEADSVDVIVRVGSGRLSMPEKQPGLEWIADYGLLNGGVVLHSSEEMDTLLSRHALSVQFGVESDASVFYVRCARRELPFAMKVITAYLTDAAYRPEAMEEVRASLGTMYTNFDTSSGGAISFRAERAITGGNTRVGWPEPNETYARSLKEVARWLTPQFKSGAIELSIVGDVPWAEATEAIASTLGALPKRDPYPSAPRDTAVNFAKPSKFPQFFPLATSLRQSAIAWYWPVTDLGDVHRERRCRLLASVLGEILYVRLREELGATYAPAADFVQYDGWPTFSYFTVRADVDSAQGAKAAQVIRHEIQHLLDQGIDEDVFLRAQQPFLRGREEDLRNNAYWGHTVLRDAQLRPERLAAARDRTSDTASIKRQELEALARQYLAPTHGFLFIAEPGPTANWGSKYLWDAK